MNFERILNLNKPCENCKNTGSLQVFCPGCKAVFYCGAVCQTKSWPQHKEVCEVAAKAKEEADKAIILTTPSFLRVFCAAGCGKQRGNPGEEPQFYRCDRCLGAFYCGRQCQLKAWPEHKGPCKEAVVVRDSMSGSKSIEMFDMTMAQFKRDAELVKGSAGYDFSSSTAQYNLGVCYNKGTGVAIDKRESIKWYTAAAESDSDMAMMRLGCHYRDGDGIDVNMHEAIKWFKRTAERGNSDAKREVGYCYEHGIGVAVDKCEAFKWYKGAAESTISMLQNMLELGFFQTATIFSFGDAIAQCRLGNLYSTGEGVAVNMNEAVKWYTLAAEKGNAEAQFALGTYYSVGAASHLPKLTRAVVCESIWADIEAGADQTIRSSNASHDRLQKAAILLKSVAEDGDCNKQESFTWFKLAAEQGHASAQQNLGTCYERGEGVAVNKKEAKKWYAMAIQSKMCEDLD